MVLGSRSERVSQASLTAVADARHSVILEVCPYTWQVDNLLNASFIQEILWPEATTLKHLWGVQPTGTEDNLLLCLDGDSRRAVWSASFLNRD
jgi:hypothetical protein